MKNRNLIVCLLLLASTASMAQTKVIAHRGYWKAEGATQNSIRSLESANQIKVYGSECDVWITKDDELVVTHDATYGPDKLPIITSTYAALTAEKLPNGETMPTFDQYLATFKKCKNTKLIIEIKTASDKERALMQTRMIMDRVIAAKLKKRVEYISFSLDVCKEVRRNDAKAKVFYLNGELPPAQLKELKLNGLDYSLGTMRKNEAWFEQARALGLKVNVWTVNSEDDMRYLIDKKTDFITTDEPEKALELVK